MSSDWRWRPRRGDAPDTGGTFEEDFDGIVHAANLLEIKEYDVFALAYRWWHGKPAPQRILEAHFKTYMYGGRAPGWVRHYVRNLLERWPLDGEQWRSFGLHRLHTPPSRPPRGERVLAVGGALAAVVLALGLVLFHSSHGQSMDRAGTPADDQRGLSCEGGGPGLHLVERLAYAVSTKEPPRC